MRLPRAALDTCGLIRHPRLRVYIMHGGAPYLQETVALMKVYPQIYADIATINWIIPREEFHEYLRALMRAGLGKRLMFGAEARHLLPQRRALPAARRRCHFRAA